MDLIKDISQKVKVAVAEAASGMCTIRIIDTLTEMRLMVTLNII